ncbi:MAG: hypothetical protein ACE5EA_04920 [Nitrospirota bacterium]
MEIKDIIQGVGEYLLPQFRELSQRLDRLETNYHEIRSVQEEMSRRISDLNISLNARMGSLENRMNSLENSLNARMNSLENSLGARMEQIESRVGNIERRLDLMDQRLDNLYQVIVRRDEHEMLEHRVKKIEEDISMIKHKLAA